MWKFSYDVSLPVTLILIPARFILQGIVGNADGLKVEESARDSIVRRTLVSRIL